MPKIGIRALRGLKGEYGRLNPGETAMIRIDLAAELAKRGLVSYLKPKPPPKTLPQWKLKTAPEVYLAQHGHRSNPSKQVQHNLELARKIVEG